MTGDSAHYTKYNTVHTNTAASKQISMLPVEDEKLVFHSSIIPESESLRELLKQLRLEKPEHYYGEIYSKY